MSRSRGAIYLRMISVSCIKDGLRELGLASGDIVLLHSSLASLGKVDGGVEAVVTAFLEVIGADGTLVVPIFEPGLGVIAEAVAGRPDAVRSIHPWASVAAVGRDAEIICRDHWKAPFAHTEATPYMRIAEKGGYVCLLGVDQDRNTTLHTVESLLRLPYLGETAPVTFPTPEGEVTKTWPYFPGPHRDFIGLESELQRRGVVKVSRIGNATVRLMRSRELIDAVLEIGRRDPAFALCTNPNCCDCVAQRAALRKAAFAEEQFTITAAASLAGRYAEEIADNCRAAGIHNVELDELRGKPLILLPFSQVEKAVSDLSDEGIRVVSLRFPAVPAGMESFVELATACDIRRLVMPLSHLSREHHEQAASHGLEISFYNLGLSSEVCSAILLAMQAEGLQPRFTFNCANFARAGELPFLSSYKKKLRRFVDQLDLEDSLYSGEPQQLAVGNGEVKEMLSILRCAGFSGYVNLGCGNRVVGDLLDAATTLQECIKTM